MSPRIAVAATVMAVMAGVTAGCAAFSDRAPGCTAPTNETALLDELAKEPALAVSLEGTRLEAGPERVTACRRHGKDVTRTAVSMRYELLRQLTIDEARAAFEPAVADRGWTALRDRPRSNDGGALLYCRDVLGQPSMLAIQWSHAHTLDIDGKPEHVPGRLSVRVVGSADGGMAEMEAERAAVGCRV